MTVCVGCDRRDLRVHGPRRSRGRTPIVRVGRRRGLRVPRALAKLKSKSTRAALSCTRARNTIPCRGTRSFHQREAAFSFFFFFFSFAVSFGLFCVFGI